MDMYRQGDILIRRIDAIPVQAEKQQAREGQFVIAEGEVTGHLHALQEKTGNTEVELYTQDQRKGWGRNAANEVEMFFSVKGGSTTLTHDEHDAITLPEGNYEVVRQREYSPQEFRRIAD